MLLWYVPALSRASSQSRALVSPLGLRCPRERSVPSRWATTVSRAPHPSISLFNLVHYVRHLAVFTLLRVYLVSPLLPMLLRGEPGRLSGKH